MYSINVLYNALKIVQKIIIVINTFYKMKLKAKKKIPELFKSEDFKPRNITEWVFLELKKMLFSYRIVPGQKLQYVDLAEKFKVSRTPVKDALKMMENEGFVELRPNRGFFVAEISSKEAEELFDIREALEILAVCRAIANQNPESMERLKKSMNEYAADAENKITRTRLILDENFHIAIAEASQNKSLVMALEKLFTRIYLKCRVENISPRRDAWAEHEEIFKNICAENVQAAVEILKKHIALSRKNVLGFLRE